MSLIKIIPNIIYKDVHIGVKFFSAMGFKIRYNDENLHIMSRDGVTIHLLTSDDDIYTLDRPEMRIETDDIEAFYTEISTNHPELLHPNLKVIKNQPWGLREFAMLDETTVCIIVQQPIQA